MHEISARAAVGMTIGMAFDFTISAAGVKCLKMYTFPHVLFNLHYIPLNDSK